jgi:hypothetical protein
MASYLTAKLVGEGFAAPDGDKTLPIDVPYAKLSEWLVSNPSLHLEESVAACRHCCIRCGASIPCSLHAAHE